MAYLEEEPVVNFAREFQCKSLVWYIIWVALSCLLISSGFRANAGSDDQAAIQVDFSLTDALRKADVKSASTLLDANFAWTDAEGNSRNKNATLKAISAFATDNRDDESVKSYFYGQLGLVYGAHHDGRFVRIWVNRPKGWQLFVDLDTPNAPDARPAALATTTNGGSAGDCDNPCTTLPYKPTTAVDKAVLAEWQKAKVDEWHPDADDWPIHIADEFMIISNGLARNKPERVIIAKQQQAAGTGAPGDPIRSMKMYDFGETVVMISNHRRYRGGKPYYNVRVFVNRDGHWPLVWSQQTTIQSEAAALPVNAKN
jgi:hypothetical protein